jgi:hypothetical protein
MCSLCGVLGAEAQWSDAAGGRGAFAGRQGQVTRRQERQRRVRLANRVLGHYGLTIADFAGQSYVLRSPTGRSEIVPDLAAVWQAAGKLAGRPCDPLDPALLIALEHP